MSNNGKYNSIGRVSDCGSGSFWFESRYLPLVLWNLQTKKLRILTTKYYFIVQILNFFKTINDYFYFNKSFLLKTTPIFRYWNIKQGSTILNRNFKDLFSLSNTVVSKELNQHKYFFFNKSKLSLSKQLFKSFIFLNTWLLTKKLVPHYSFNVYYFLNSGSNVGIFNIKKLFLIWSSIMWFISNIFFYKIPYLVFSNSYFKYETLSINWYYTSIIKSIWRYTHPFVFFLNNKTTLKTEFYFKQLLQEGYRLSFVLDIYYHKKTIYYFNKLKFITLGPVPITSNLYLLSVTLPVSSNSVFSNLFFMRLLLKLKKLNSSQVFSLLLKN